MLEVDSCHLALQEEDMATDVAQQKQDSEVPPCYPATSALLTNRKANFSPQKKPSTKMVALSWENNGFHRHQLMTVKKSGSAILFITLHCRSHMVSYGDIAIT